MGRGASAASGPSGASGRGPVMPPNADTLKKLGPPKGDEVVTK